MLFPEKIRSRIATDSEVARTRYDSRKSIVLSNTARILSRRLDGSCRLDKVSIPLEAPARDLKLVRKIVLIGSIRRRGGWSTRNEEIAPKEMIRVAPSTSPEWYGWKGPQSLFCERELLFVLDNFLLNFKFCKNIHFPLTWLSQLK